MMPHLLCKMVDDQFLDQICHVQSDDSDLNVKNTITKLGLVVDLIHEKELFKMCVGSLIGVNRNWM